MKYLFEIRSAPQFASLPLVTCSSRHSARRCLGLPLQIKGLPPPGASSAASGASRPKKYDSGYVDNENQEGWQSDLQEDVLQFSNDVWSVDVRSAHHIERQLIFMRHNITSSINTYVYKWNNITSVHCSLCALLQR